MSSSIRHWSGGHEAYRGQSFVSTETTAKSLSPETLASLEKFSATPQRFRILTQKKQELERKLRTQMFDSKRDKLQAELNAVLSELHILETDPRTEKLRSSEAPRTDEENP